MRDTERPERSGRWWYVASLLTFTLAMLAKGSVAVLPALLLLIVWWRRGNITRTDQWRTVPFFAIAIVLTIVNVWSQGRAGASAVRDAGPGERLLAAGATIWFYLYSALSPFALSFVYPQWNVRVADPRWWIPLVAALAVTITLIRYRTSAIGRSALLAWGFFCVALVPVMGFVDVYFMRYALVADHYQYIAILAVVTAVGALLSKVPGLVGYVLAPALIVGAAFLTWNQARLYGDARTLYVATIAVNEHAWLARNNLALLYLHDSPADLHGAREQLEAAVRTNPREPTLQNNLGTVFFQLSQFHHAATAHREAVRLDPTFADAHCNLGADLLKLGDYDGAVTAYRAALRLNPAMTFVRADLAHALDALGRADEAAAERRHVTTPSQSPATAKDHGASADALFQLGRTDEAITQYLEAARLDPSSAAILNNLGNALVKAGRYPEAERYLRRALQLRPGDPAAHNNLGNVLQRTDRLDEAIAEHQLALQTGTGADLAPIHNDLGTAFARQGRLDDAVRHFREALRLNPAHGPARANLERAQSLLSP